MKMARQQWLVFLPVVLVTGGLTACASLLGGGEVKVRPINNMSGLTTEPRDPLYESAVTAIDQRDYGRALDYLQEDKGRDPRNIKVLNALGVVYDKLGRFDLSARYYAQAQAIDPTSRIVAANMGYSNTLQGLMSPGRGTVVTMDLPSDFNREPAGVPTVVGLAPKTSAAARPTENQAMISTPTNSAALVPVMPPAKIANTVSTKPKFVQPIPSPVQEANRAVASDTAPIARAMTQAAVAPTTATAAQSVEKPVVIAAAPAKIDTVAKSGAHVAEPVAVGATPVIAAAALVAKPEPAAAAPVKIDTATKPEDRVPEPAAVEAATPVMAVAVPVAKPVFAAVAPSKGDATTKPQARVGGTAAAKVASPVPLAAQAPAAKPVVIAAVPVRSPAAQSANQAIQSPRPIALPVVPPIASPRPAHVVLVAPSAKRIFIIGQPVRLINASGKADRVGVVSRRLGALGWTIRLTGAGPAQLVTTLIYNPRNTGAAKAMQRTLPFPIRLVAERGAVGMRLIVGRDYLSWKPKNARVYALWQKAPAVAGLQKISLKWGR